MATLLLGWIPDNNSQFSAYILFKGIRDGFWLSKRTSYFAMEKFANLIELIENE